MSAEGAPGAPAEAAEKLAEAADVSGTGTPSPADKLPPDRQPMEEAGPAAAAAAEQAEALAEKSSPALAEAAPAEEAARAAGLAAPAEEAKKETTAGTEVDFEESEAAEDEEAMNALELVEAEEAITGAEEVLMAKAAQVSPRILPKVASTDSSTLQWKSQPLRRPKRTAGIENLGQTCFMSSGLQCLANIPGIQDRFCGGPDSTKGSGLHGHFAAEFSTLVRCLWSKQNVPAESLCTFWHLVGERDERFRSNEQQDSMEFIEFTIDSLRDDCGLQAGPPPTSVPGPDAEDALQTWKRQLMQSQNAIEELLVGAFQTTISCPEPSCGHESVKLESFSSVKLPVLNPNEIDLVSQMVMFVPSVASRRKISRHILKIPKLSTANDVVAAAKAEGLCGDCGMLSVVHLGILKFFDTDDASKISTTAGLLILYEIEEGSFPAICEIARAAQQNSEKPPEASDDSSERRVCPDDSKAYTFKELKKAFAGEYSVEDLKAYWKDAMAPLADDLTADAQSMIIIHSRRISPRTSRRELVGLPFVFCMERRTTPRQLACAIRSEFKQRFQLDDADSGWKLFQSTAGWDACKAETLMWHEADAGDAMLGLREQEHLVVEWQGSAPAPLLDMQALVNVHRGPEKVQELESCFEWYTNREQLTKDNAVLCDGCKKRVPAFTSCKIAYFPVVLVVQLKRFEYRSGLRHRLLTPVHVPLEGLHLARFGVGHSGAEGQAAAEPLYDLAAVSGHFGGLDGGHYWAYARSSEDGTWSVYDDEKVFDTTPSHIENDFVCPYVLFYLRRDKRPIGWGPPAEGKPVAQINYEKGVVGAFAGGARSEE